MAIITKKQAQEAGKRTHADVHIPELGGEMRLLSLFATQAMEAEHMGEQLRKGENVAKKFAAFILEHSAVDENGKSLYTPAEALRFVDEHSIETIKIILKGFPKASDKTVETIAGNSEASPSAS